MPCDSTDEADRGNRELMLGYAWLLAGSGYWFARSIFDLTLVRRPDGEPEPDDGRAELHGPGAVRRAHVGRACGGRPTRAAGPGRQAARADRAGPGPGDGGRLSRPRTEPVSTRRRTMCGSGSNAALAMICHAAVVVGLLMIGMRHFQDRTAGLAMATLYLLRAVHRVPHRSVAPRLADGVSRVGGLLLSPAGRAGWLLGLAAGTSLFPGAPVPALVRVLLPVAASGDSPVAFLSAVVVSVGVDGARAVAGRRSRVWTGRGASLPDWQPWRVPHDREHLDAERTGRIACRSSCSSSAFLAAVAVWPSPKNLSHLIALSAAVLIGVQFWHADRGGVYVLWYLAPVSAHGVPPEPLDGRTARTGNRADGPVGRRRLATRSTRPAATEGTRGLAAAIPPFPIAHPCYPSAPAWEGRGWRGDGKWFSG